MIVCSEYHIHILYIIHTSWKDKLIDANFLGGSEIAKRAAWHVCLLETKPKKSNQCHPRCAGIFLRMYCLLSCALTLLGHEHNPPTDALRLEADGRKNRESARARESSCSPCVLDGGIPIGRPSIADGPTKLSLRSTNQSNWISIQRFNTAFSRFGSWRVPKTWSPQGACSCAPKA